MKRLKSENSGLTLLETIFYIIVVIAITLSVVAILLFMVRSIRSIRSTNSIDTAVAIAGERLMREIRLANSIDITNSDLRVHPGVLQLNTVVSPTDDTPTTKRFFLSNGDIQLQEGSSPAIALTSSSTVITRFVFYPPADPTGDVFYVRGSYVGCSDTASGQTPATAWCTIGHAASVLTAGDTVYVGAGTYDETVTPLNSGSAGTPISYVADASGVYTGDVGVILLDSGATKCHAFDVSLGQSYLIIDGFEATGYRDCGGNDATYYFLSGDNNIYRHLVASSTGRDGFALGGSNNILKNCISHNVLDDGMEPYGSTNVVENCTFTESTGYAIETDISYVNTYTNNIIDGTMGTVMTDFDASIFNYNDWTGGVLAGVGNISADPLFVDTDAHDFHLSQTAAGQGADSPAIDIGSDTAVALGLDIRTTRTDDVGDIGQIDMGYHYQSASSSILSTLHSEWVRFLITVETGSGDAAKEETFYGTAVLRGSY